MKTIFVCSDHFTGVWDFSWENFTILLMPGEMRGLAYIINSPIPGKTCFKLTSRHKKGLFRERMGKRKWYSPLSHDNSPAMTQCLLTLIFIIPRVCLLSVTPSFCFRQELVPSPPTLRVFYFEIQLYTVYCQCSMCWVSKLLLLSYYCGNVCLSLPC